MVIESIRDWTPSHEQAEGLEMEWVPVQHAACRLRVSPTTVRRWLKSGKLNGRVSQHCGRASHLVGVPAPLGHLSQGTRNQVEVLRAQLATREMQLAVLTHQNEKLEGDLDALRRTLSLQTRRRIAESEVLSSKARGLARWAPFLRLSKGRRRAG